MLAVSILVSAVVAAAAGGCIGLAFGFSLAAHPDIMSGYRPRTRNRFLLFIFRPTAELAPAEALLFLVLIAVWLVLLALLCAAPSEVAIRLDGPGTPAMVIAVLVQCAAFYIGRNAGRNLWLRLL